MNDQSNFSTIINKISAILKSNKIDFFTDSVDGTNGFKTTFELYMKGECFEPIVLIAVSMIKHNFLSTDEKGWVKATAQNQKLEINNEKYKDAVGNIKTGQFVGKAEIFNISGQPLIEQLSEIENQMKRVVGYINAIEKFQDDFFKFQTELLKYIK